MKEKLDFIIDGSKIAELFGLQNFASPENAILEIVKNSYDSGATIVDILFNDDSLTIRDNGNGMDADIIKKNWMHVGKSDKKYKFTDVENNEKVYSGSKGVGRFAIARLGESVVITSQKQGCKKVVWETDWENNYLTEIDEPDFKTGTEILIKELREQVSSSFVENLSKYLGKAGLSTKMSINVIYNGDYYYCKSPYEEILVGKNCLSSINMKYNSSEALLRIDIVSDEFEDNVQEIVRHKNKKIDIKKHIVEIHVDKYIIKLKTLKKYSTAEISNALLSVGDFKVDLFFNNAYTKQDAIINHYKRIEKLPYFVEDDSEVGISLYRNSFCIPTFDGSIDWLNLGKRSRKSPAAPSHPTGSWRVRENQICGFAVIDKIANENIQEMQNRQGIVDNVFFSVFKEIIICGILEFERYRQSISRIINPKHYDTKKRTENKVIFDFLKNPKSFSEYSPSQIEELAQSINREFNEYEKNSRITEEIIEDQKYSIRLLNSLSTIGLKSSWIAHELDTDRNNLTSYYDFIVKALKKYGMWDALCNPEHTVHSNLNVPELLESNKKVSSRLISFIDSILTTIEKEKFTFKEINLEQTIKNISSSWMEEYGFITITTDIQVQNMFSAEDIIETILSNLILNSIQQNKNFDSLIINIEVKKEHGKILFSYKDNGIGLAEMFLDNPLVILEPHVTSRDKGHGLGMWIVNNTIVSTGGEVVDIIGNPGFRIDFILGENENE